MSQENSEFQRLEASHEKENFLRALAAQDARGSVYTDDTEQFLTRLSRVDGQRIHLELEAPAPRVLKVGEGIQAIFGLTEGLYSVKTKIAGVEGGRFFFDLGGDAFRLQRRNDFRTTIPSGARFEVKFTHLRGSALTTPIVFQPIDLSAGGLSVRWNDFQKYNPVSGEGVEGALILPGGEQIKFKSKIRTVSETDATSGVFGLQFLKLSLQDRQRLLFTCVQIRRRQF